MSEMINAYTYRSKSLSSLFSSHDSGILNRWPLISIPFKRVLIGKQNKKERRKEIKWDPLDKDFVKLDFDGASRGNPGISGAGYVPRDSDSQVIRAACSRIPIGYNNIAEARALHLGMGLSISNGIQRIHIEGDSQIITSTIELGHSASWEIH